MDDFKIDLKLHFIAKVHESKAQMPEYADFYDQVRHDQHVWFYNLPLDTNAEDFAAAVAIAFETDADPREVMNFDGIYRIDLS
jgi:hypothetical protein